MNWKATPTTGTVCYLKKKKKKSFCKQPAKERTHNRDFLSFHTASLHWRWDQLVEVQLQFLIIELVHVNIII